MRRTRVLPVLLMNRGQLMKTTKFDAPRYVGDPVNTVRLFSERSADELVVLDVSAGDSGPDFATLRALAAEAFMPVAYGGGIRSADQAQAVLDLGMEKVVIGRAAVENPALLEQIASRSGAQSVVACIDYVRRSLGRGKRVVTERGRRVHDTDPTAHARAVVDAGAGEILLQSVERDGTMTGYDVETIAAVAAAVPVPVVACGGAGTVEHLREAVDAGASAAAAGSMFTFYGKHRAVLISYPGEDVLDASLP